MSRLMCGYSRVAAFRRDTPYTVADRLEERAREHGDRPFIIFEGRSLTFAEANAAANRIAHAALAQGLKRGDVVALLMNNRPEFVLVWLGLAKVGIVTGLLNTSATGPTLVHALGQIAPAAMIFDEALADSVAELPRGALPPLLLCQAEYGAPSAVHGAIDFNAACATSPAADPDPAARAGIVMGDPLYLIFTSGTTGLPKAARMSHLRFVGAGETQGGLMGIGPDDVHYCVLPLYHGAGGMAVVSVALAFAIPFVLRRRFSVSAFWDDVREHDITTVQYIGEVCRYLLNVPPSSDDRNHPLCRLIGAGLKGDIWRRFSERFGVTAIFEGLGGTECNYTLLNVDGKVGSVGRLPYPEQSTVRVLAYDFDNQGYFATPSGAPRLAVAGEVGELVAQVLPGPDGAGFFEGYTDPAASEAKLLRDLFEPGDIWFRSGDLVRFDEDDYFYFVDRVGDTFRWKSENVSTEEVALVLGGFAGPELVNVYGVEIPGAEGRAGMVALTYGQLAQFDPAAFHAYARERLPHYAVPVFVRVSTASEITTTFKLRKIDLQREGYDPAAVGTDALYVLDQEQETYVPLTDASLRRLGIAPFLRPDAGGNPRVR